MCGTEGIKPVFSYAFVAHEGSVIDFDSVASRLQVMGIL